MSSVIKNSDPITSPLSQDRIGANASPDINDAVDAVVAKYQKLQDDIKELQKLVNDQNALLNDPQRLMELVKAMGDPELAFRFFAALSGGDAIFYKNLTPEEVKQIINNIPLVREQNEAIDALLNEINGTDAPLGGTITKVVHSIQDSIYQLLADGVGVDRFKEDIKLLTESFNTIIQALLAKANADKDLEVMNTLSDDPNNLESGQDLLAYVQDAILNQRETQDLLTTLLDKLDDAVVDFHQQYDDADADLSSIHWWDEWFGSGNEQEAEDHSIMRNATDMQNLIAELEGSFMSEISSLAPDFMLAVITLKDIMKKMKKILSDPTLSKGEKNKQILQLVASALTVLNQIMSLVTQSKSQMDREMAKTASNQSEMNVQDTIMNATKAENAKKYAEIMGPLMKAGEALVGVALALIAPTVGAMIAMILITALQTAGVFDQLIEKLADETGNKAAAEAIVVTMEVAATMGGGKAIDSLTQKALQTAMNAVTAGMRTLVDVGASKLVTAATTPAAEAALKASMEAAFRAGAEKAFIQFFKQGIKEILPVLKAAAKGNVLPWSAMAKAAEPSMIEAGTAAMNAAGKEATPLITKISQGLPLTAAENEQLMLSIPDSAANQAVANMTNTTAQAIEKATAKESRVALKRAAIAALYGMGSTNLLVDTSIEIHKARGKDEEDDSFQDFLIFMQALQMLMSLVSGIMASGQTAQFTSKSGLFNLMAAFEALGIGAGIVGNYGQYEANLQQAAIATGTSKQQAEFDVINLTQDRINKASQRDGDKGINLMSDDLKSTLTLSSHLFDSSDATARVIAG